MVIGVSSFCIEHRRTWYSLPRFWYICLPAWQHFLYLIVINYYQTGMHDCVDIHTYPWKSTIANVSRVKIGNVLLESVPLSIHLCLSRKHLRGFIYRCLVLSCFKFAQKRIDMRQLLFVGRDCIHLKATKPIMASSVVCNACCIDKCYNFFERAAFNINTSMCICQRPSDRGVMFMKIISNRYDMQTNPICVPNAGQFICPEGRVVFKQIQSYLLTHWRHVATCNLVNSDFGNGIMLSGNKSLPEPMLTSH